MSEVKRYASDPCNFRFLTWVAVKHGGSELADVVVAQEFDRVTAELDTAKETLERWYRLNVQREAKVDALQQRLTAADERADVLETALKKISARCAAYIEAEREMPEPSVEVCQMIASAALKPAEAPRNQCDGCQAGIPLINGTHRMGREGGYPDFMGCSAKLYKPAEGGGDEAI